MQRKSAFRLVVWFVCICVMLITSTDHFPTHKKVKLIFYPILPDFPNSIVFWKAPEHGLLVHLEIAACRWRWVWNTDGIVQMGENRSRLMGGKPVSFPLSPPHTYMDWPGIEPGLARWKADDKLLKPWHGHFTQLARILFIMDTDCFLWCVNWTCVIHTNISIQYCLCAVLACKQVRVVMPRIDDEMWYLFVCKL